MGNIPGVVPKSTGNLRRAGAGSGAGFPTQQGLHPHDPRCDFLPFRMTSTLRNAGLIDRIDRSAVQSSTFDDGFSSTFVDIVPPPPMNDFMPTSGVKCIQGFWSRAHTTRTSTHHAL